ncbi:MAG: 16S rRNA (uracil(1498)-N(3))-methyltransferase [Campylobacterota bacterium]|nr:16S rRNA (uracil(1498)-N(3))-methyltransferase [Campylobacterota bacterium]
MQFTYHKDSGDEFLTIEADIHKYLFKIRRHNIDENLYFRNLKDKNIYQYKVDNITRRQTTLKLINCEKKSVEPSKYLHIGWCLIDFKSIEKVIASLNELGVTKITFISCEYSQKQYKINFEKLNKLLINSSQQSGRSSIIEIDTYIYDSIDKFLQNYPNSYMFNFSSNNIVNSISDIKTIVLGCEGGFSIEEVNKFSDDKIVGVDSNLILRSETAIVTIASKILV